MVADGYKDTEIGVVPIEWDVVELETITTILLSNVDKKSKNDEQAVKLCNYMDVYNNPYITNDLVYMEATAKDNQIEKFQLQINDVIITKDSETKDDIAIPAVVMETFENLLCGYHLAVLRPKENILNGVYLMNAIQSIPIHKHFEKLANGITRFGLTSSAINQALIPLAPLKEQKKIADILSTADDKIDAIAIQIEKAETLKKGLLQKLLSEGLGHSEFKDSELGKIPASWEVVRLGEIGNLEGGFAFKSKEYTDNNLDYQVIRMSNINSKGLNLEKAPKYIKNIEKKAEKYILNIDDLLITLTGTIGKTDYGNIALISEERKMVLNQRVGRFVLSSNTNTTKFLYYVFRHQSFRSKFFEFGKGGTGNQANVGRGDFETIKVSLPPLEEQKQIADILSTADEKLEVLRAKKEKYEVLKKGLMQKLLTGEVRV